MDQLFIDLVEQMQYIWTSLVEQMQLYDYLLIEQMQYIWTSYLLIWLNKCNIYGLVIY